MWNNINNWVGVELQSFQRVFITKNIVSVYLIASDFQFLSTYCLQAKDLHLSVQKKFCFLYVFFMWSLLILIIFFSSLQLSTSVYDQSLFKSTEILAFR